MKDAKNNNVYRTMHGNIKRIKKFKRTFYEANKLEGFL
jgi:hypothetical protein